MRSLVIGVAIVALAACNNGSNVQCDQNSNCDLSGGGMCIAASTGNMWCAYPDPLCPGGYRYSDQSIGDGVSGQCVPDNTMVDAGVDAPPDVPIDGPAVIPGSWGKQIPGAGFESVDAVAVSPDGSVFIVGSFDGTVDLGGGPLAATGTNDVFVAKFTSAGQHVWSKRFGGSGAAGANEVRVLSTGDLVIGGTYRGSVTLGTTTLTSSSTSDVDVFIARLSGTGDAVWAVTGGTTTGDTLRDLDVDSNDNIVACGGYNGSGTFFGAAFSGSYDPWLVRLTSAGATSWSKPLAVGGIAQTCSVAMTPGGDVVFGANFNGTVNAGGSTFTSVANSLDMFIARFAGATGAHVWSVPKGGTGNEEVIDVDASGTAVVLTGYFGGTINFGGAALTSAGGDDTFVVKLDAATGAHQFSIRTGGTTTDEGMHISTRPDGQITVAGIFAGTSNFGGTTITSNGDTDPFVIDVDGSTGAVVSVKSVGGISRDEAHGVASTADSLVFAGSFANSITVLGQTYTSMGGLDGYVIRYKR